MKIRSFMVSAIMLLFISGSLYAGDLTVSGVLDVEGGTAATYANGANTIIKAQNAGTSGFFVNHTSGGNIILTPGSANGVYSSPGAVGIGTSSPASLLSVGGSGVSNTAIYGHVADIPISGSWGVVGEGHTGVYGSGAYGVSGNGGIGVIGCGTSKDFFAQCTGTYMSGSSIRWKKNITSIDTPLDKIMALRGVRYDTDKDHSSMREIGFIGEEVAKVVPELTEADPDAPGYVTGIDYSRLTPILVEAMKEQQKQIADLKQQIADLNKQIFGN